MGLTPYNSPGALCLLAGTDLTDGVWYPMGGWKGIKESLGSLAAQHGVEIKCDTEVEEVLVEEKKAVGVRLKGGELEKADVVVVNADTPYAYEKLLGHSKSEEVSQTAEDLNAREYSCGVIAFFWVPVLAS